MKKKPTSEELQLWKTQVRDVVPLTKKQALSAPPPLPLRPFGEVPQSQSRVPAYTPASHPLPSLGRKALRRIRIEARLDMHGLTLDSGYDVLETFLRQAQERGLRTLLIITGKGAVDRENTLRHQVPRWLRYSSLRRFVVSLHHPARIQDGGTGAYYVEVKRKG